MGALNEAYNFLYTWLWSTAPVSAFSPYAESITIFIALFFVCAMMWFAYRLVTGIIRLVYYMFEG